MKKLEVAVKEFDPQREKLQKLLDDATLKDSEKKEIVLGFVTVYEKMMEAKYPRVAPIISESQRKDLAKMGIGVAFENCYQLTENLSVARFDLDKFVRGSVQRQNNILAVSENSRPSNKLVVVYQNRQIARLSKEEQQEIDRLDKLDAKRMAALTLDPVASLNNGRFNLFDAKLMARVAGEIFRGNRKKAAQLYTDGFPQIGGDLKNHPSVRDASALSMAMMFANKV